MTRTNDTKPAMSDFWKKASWAPQSANDAAVPVSETSKHTTNRDAERFGATTAPGTVVDKPNPNADPNMAVEVRNLTWSYEAGSFEFDVELPPALRDVSLSVPAGSRLLLIGANGAGKSTLLRILGGRHMIERNAALVLGRPAFHDTRLVNNVALIAERWSMVGDVSVTELVSGVPEDLHARRDALMEVLDVDPDWRCFRLSDGQRRRVQILCALLKHTQVMLLDEITTDLDVVGRQNLLKYLHAESVQNGVTLMYATHIFDGLDGWGTHIAYIRDGRMERFGSVSEFPELKADLGVRSPLFALVEKWLRAEWEEKRKQMKRRAPEPLIGLGDQTMFTDRTRGEGIPIPGVTSN